MASPPRSIEGKETVAAAPSQSDRSKSLSILKAHRILESVASHERGVTAKAVSVDTGLSPTVCVRMLHTLEDVQLITRNEENGRYRLGLGILELAHRARLQNPVNLRAAALLQEIAEETGDVAILMAEDRGEGVCLDRVDGEYPLVGRGNQVGNRLPLHTGGAGFALLAFNSDDFIDAFLDLPREKLTERTVTDPEEIRARIAEARRQGYTEGIEDQALHIAAVGVPLFSPEGRLIAAISVGGIVQRMDAERRANLGEYLKKKAATFARNLF